MTPQQPYFPPPMHGLTTIWRHKSGLVMTKEALLPNRCIKCNVPTGERIKRKLQWHHPALYFLILLSILVYAVVAMVLRKRATVDLGLCEDHLAARRQSIAVTWILALLSVVSFVVAAQFESATFLIAGTVLLFATAIYGIVKLRVVVPTRIDEHYVWLKGISTSYLREFPEWNGRA